MMAFTVQPPVEDVLGEELYAPINDDDSFSAVS